MQEQTNALNDGFGHWLAGFIDGEGCFQIDRVRRTYACRFTLAVRGDDLPVLEEAQRLTGLGVIRPHRSARAAWNPGVRWAIHSKTECQRLIVLLDQFPLRAKKRRDYLIWREAVTLWAQVVQKGGPWGSGHNWSTIGQLAEALKAGRQYMSESAKGCDSIDSTQLELLGGHNYQQRIKGVGRESRDRTVGLSRSASS